MRILITGTPGTGKSTIGKKLAKALGLLYVDVHSHIIKHHLHSGYDRSRRCYIIDGKTLQKVAKDFQNEVILDSLASHEIFPADICIVTICDLKTLSLRLKKRGYSAKKITENVEAEAFEICKLEAIEKGHKVFVIDTTKNVALKKILFCLKKALSSKKYYHELV